MLEKSFGVNFFLKTPWKKDDISKEISTKRKWRIQRWIQKTERAVGTKEDAKSLNHFLDSIVISITKLRTELHNSGQFIISQRTIDHIKGKDVSQSESSGRISTA